MMNGIRIPEQYPSETRGQPEQTCKFCGGFLMLKWCQNPSCDRYNDKFRASDKTTFCEECDELLALKSITNPCPNCLKNEPDTIQRRFDRLDKDALKVELGESDSSLEEFCSVEDASRFLGEGWQGYRIEIFGYKVGRYSEWYLPNEFFEAVELLPDDLRQKWMTMHPLYLMPFPSIMIPEDSDLIIRLLRLRARYEESPLYTEMRAHHYGVRRVAIHGLEHNHSAIDLERAVKGRELLIKVAPPEPHSGRPRDLEGETLSSIATTYAWLCFCCDYVGLTAPDQEDLRQAYNDVSRTTLYRHTTQKLNGSWPGVKKEGKRIAKTLTLETVPRFIKVRYGIQG